MSGESSDRHGAAEDERIRDRREKRIRAEATADAVALAERRMQCLRVDPDPTEIDLPGVLHLSRICTCGCGDPIQTDHPNALYAHEACKTRAYRHRQHEALQSGRVTPQTPRKRIDQMTQTERVERALTIAGPKGITQIDFDLPNVIDGGAPIKRVAARVLELRDQGKRVESKGRRKKCTVYVLEPTGQLFAPDSEPVAA